MSNLRISQKAIEVITHYESLHDGDLKRIGLQPKECPAGYWTIGYGHMVKDLAGKPFSGPDGFRKMIEMYPEWETITEQQAIELLDEDCDYFERVVNNLNLDLNQNQFDALVSLCFNIGEGNLKESTLLRLLNNMKVITYSVQVRDAFLMWNKSKGVLSRGLASRRQTEALLFASGEVKFFN